MNKKNQIEEIEQQQYTQDLLSPESDHESQQTQNQQIESSLPHSRNQQSQHKHQQSQKKIEEEEEENNSTQPQRFIPGPVGFLPPLIRNKTGQIKFPKDEGFFAASAADSSERDLPSHKILQEDSALDFEGPEWQEMLREVNRVKKENSVKWTIGKIRSQISKSQKIPEISVMLKGFVVREQAGQNVLVILKDETSEIKATIHHAAFEKYSNLLVNQTVLVLKNVSIFCPNIHNQYLIITQNTIDKIYPAKQRERKGFLSQSSNASNQLDRSESLTQRVDSVLKLKNTISSSQNDEQFQQLPKSQFVQHQQQNHQQQQPQHQQQHQHQHQQHQQRQQYQHQQPQQPRQQQQQNQQPNQQQNQQQQQENQQQRTVYQICLSQGDSSQQNFQSSPMFVPPNATNLVSPEKLISEDKRTSISSNLSDDSDMSPSFALPKKPTTTTTTTTPPPPTTTTAPKKPFIKIEEVTNPTHDISNSLCISTPPSFLDFQRPFKNSPLTKMLTSKPSLPNTDQSTSSSEESQNIFAVGNNNNNTNNHNSNNNNTNNNTNNNNNSNSKKINVSSSKSTISQLSVSSSLSDDNLLDDLLSGMGNVGKSTRNISDDDDDGFI